MDRPPESHSQTLLTITPQALEQARRLLREAGREGYWLRVEVVGRSDTDFIYRLIFIPADLRKPEDTLQQADGLHLVFDPLSARYLAGSTLRYVQSPEESGFKIDNPNPLWRDPLGSRVQAVIEQKVNPGIAVHGGRVTLLDVDQGVAYINMSGGCQGCGLASVTLKQGVEKMIRESAPEITQVVDTTEHALGVSPYYRSPQGQSPLA
jgi:Fe/S biogenesis protein NfuA